MEQMFDDTYDLMRSTLDKVKQHNKSKNKYKQLYHLVILPILHYKMMENCNTNEKKINGKIRV